MLAVVVGAALSLTSPAFAEGANIPSKYTCDAGQTNPSPALTWKDAPANAKSFVLIMHDPDAPLAGGFTHWVLFDIPATTTRLPENFQAGSVGVSGHSGFRPPGHCGPGPARRLGQRRLPPPGLWRPVSAERRASLSLHAVGARRRDAGVAGGRHEGRRREGDAGPCDRLRRSQP